MYQCKSCGGNLKFDIESQQLKCDYCGNSEDPASFVPDKDAWERRINTGEYEATIFTCSQCGAEIISDDTTVATFCNFCGGTAVLHSRISHEKCPDKIIPFKKTKEDCKKAYRKLTRFALFAPSGMKREESIDRFRGIYMPFYLYDFKKKGTFKYEGIQALRTGDYINNNKYEMSSNVDIDLSDIPYDASSAFADNLSNAITPFDMRDALPFTPSYLSGFYADTSDVDQAVYQEEAIQLVGDEVYSRLEERAEIRNYYIDRKSITNALKQEAPEGRLALMPVWFLSYRNKDRICYAVVNGQTGKAAADLPIDYGKYLLGSLLLAIPLFFLLNFFLSFQISGIVIFAILFSVLCAGYSLRLRRELKARQTYRDDLGMMYRMELNRQNLHIPEESSPKEDILKEEIPKEDISKTKDTFADDQIKLLLDEHPEYMKNRKYVKYMKNKSRKGMESKYNYYTVIAFIVGLIGAVIFLALFLFILFYIELPWPFQRITLLIASVCLLSSAAWMRSCIEWGRKKKNAKIVKNKINVKKKRKYEVTLSARDVLPSLIIALLGIIPSVAILILQPISDMYYYGASILVIGLNLMSVFLTIRTYNLLTTRKLPQFNVRGGEENE